MEDYDPDEYATCHTVGISGNCGANCPVFMRGECEEFTEDNIEPVFECHDPKDALDILGSYHLDAALKYCVVNNIEVPIEYRAELSDKLKWMINYGKSFMTNPDIKKWESVERLYNSFSTPPLEHWSWCMDWCKLQGVSPADSVSWNKANEAWKNLHELPTNAPIQGKASLGLFDPSKMITPRDFNFQIVDPYNKADKMNRKLFLL